jgi:hypothetical protein
MKKMPGIFAFLSPFGGFRGLLFVLLLTCAYSYAQLPAETIRHLRYRPEGTDFVITNGTNRFNRALYGSNTAFRVEAGDLPEFAMYLPGMGGNLKFGLSDGKTSKWLTDAQTIIARYRPGSMLYTIADPMLAGGNLEMVVLPLAEAEGLIVKLTSGQLPDNLELVVAYGGATGKKFSREGDLGADPESSFDLNPAYCADNEYQISGTRFAVYFGSGPDKSEAERYWNSAQPTPEQQNEIRLKSKRQLAGLFPPDCQLKISDANSQAAPDDFQRSEATANPALSGMLPLKSTADYWFLITNPETFQLPEYTALPVVFEKAEKQRKSIAERIQINTPDPYLNTVGGALAIAADAIWEAPSYLHGAVAWRMRLNGWRGAYAADALGWHDRAQTHFSEYIKAQYLEPASGPSVPDPKTNLARQEEKVGTAIFTEGYVSRNPGKVSPPNHYDMNLVFFDQVLRHFNWTGDTAYLRRLWPAIERHLAWEKRNFDADNDGLYDAYACIWASDALQYSGGGVAHSSAYNYFANKTAAHLAGLIGMSPKPYQTEAERILTALNRYLWLPAQGWFAEYKDLLGRQLVHPSAALWTIYHAIDSEVPDGFQAWQCLRYIDSQIPHIPVRANGLSGEYYTLSTTNWMPYTWSINNVASGEVFHTALAYWQAGRNNEAFRIMKSSLLDYMYLGTSPGNFGQISYYDAFRGELYRDFADGIGIASRALTEGLFGIRPDATNGKLLISPGFPDDWNSASIKTPDIALKFGRDGKTDQYHIESEYFRKLQLKLRIKAQTDQVKRVQVNGLKVEWTCISDAVGSPEIEISFPACETYDIRVEWQGSKPEQLKPADFYALGDRLKISLPKAAITDVNDPQQILRQLQFNDHSLLAVVSGEWGTRTAFVKLRQGDLSWWHPLQFEVRPAVEILADKQQPGGSLKFSVRNNSGRDFSGTVETGNFSQKLNLKPHAASSGIVVPQMYLCSGSNVVKVVSGEQTFQKNLINWQINAKPESRFETVGLSGYFNDSVTQIFKNQYLSPRSPYPTLSVPAQGIGDWCSYKETAEIDDSGLRKLAGSPNRILSPEGIPFETPGQAGKRNIVFASMWDNYPDSVTLPLSGKASHVYLLMAGSTHHMQSRMMNGLVRVEYTDGTFETLPLVNPDNWWPIEQDYFIDGLAFQVNAPQPPRLYLKTGEWHPGSYAVWAKNKTNKIEGGAASMLDLPLNPEKTLRSLTLEARANDVVIGLMAVTLKR